MKRILKLIKLTAFFLIALFTGCTSQSVTRDNVHVQSDKKENQGKVTMKEINIPNKDVENGVIFGQLFLPEGEGKFPLIITSHGYNGCHTDFFEDCKYYSENGFAAFCYDFAGGSSRSKSTGKSTDMTLLSEKANLITVMDYFSKEDYIDSNNIILMGASQGGMVSALVADERPEKVKALALYYPAFCIPDNWRDKYPSDDKIPETVNFWGLELGKAFFESTIKLHVEELTGKYSGPVIVIHGTSDDVVPLHYSEEAKNRYSNAELKIFTGERHGFSPEASIEARKLVLSFAQNAIN